MIKTGEHRFKYKTKTKKGLPIYQTVETWFDYNEKTHVYTQKQQWHKEKPEEIK